MLRKKCYFMATTRHMPPLFFDVVLSVMKTHRCELEKNSLLQSTLNNFQQQASVLVRVVVVGSAVNIVN